MDKVVSTNLSRIKDLMVLHGVVNAYLFGSAASNTMDDDSDVDFVVKFNADLDYTKYGENFFALIYSLQHLLNKNVDIIAEETITNPYLLAKINSQKIPVL